ncbi:MAG: mechanosensitive ion channel family protein [ANME-2 cluster archaeon]|nr:mechanosensitive ion channel family protein [ANME-2 cluster archaeon]
MAIITIYIHYFSDYFSAYSQELNKLLLSIIIILGGYLANYFTGIIIKRQIQEVKERYAFKKAVSTLIAIIVMGVLIAVWFKETTSLIVAYGIISAGIAIALQDVLKNVAGGLIIFISRPFRAGDRIQVETEMGDVLDINVFNTTLMEMRQWVDGDQYSGRIIHLPNGFILNKTMKNYTRDFSFIWDEIHLMLTYDSDWRKAQKIVIDIAKDVTKETEMSAKQELHDMAYKYLITPVDVESKIYTQITDNWIDMRLRYVVNPHQRRINKHLMNEKILDSFLKEKDIKIASATYEIVGFPAVKIDT